MNIWGRSRAWGSLVKLIIPERFEEFKHAEIINYNLEIVYKNLNYNLIEIPKMSIIQRAKYVIKKINSWKILG